MTIADYTYSKNWSSLLEQDIEHSKTKNQENPAVLRREDSYRREKFDEQVKKEFSATPLLIKDNILLEWTISSFWSTIGENYLAPYSASVVKKLEEAWFLIVGKTAMDEFAMWSKGENSPFPIPYNSIDETRVAGGSSSGSAVAVANNFVPVALWTDTGGSVRTPAAYNGIIWLKPSYGAVSRYGVQAMASSFDQVWIFARTIQDARSVFRVIRGQDDRDTTTKEFDRTQRISSLSWLRIGIPKQFFASGLNPAIAKITQELISRYQEQWAEPIELDIPLLDAGIAVYYTLVNAEISANLARFDGLKYGQQADTHQAANHHDYISKLRDSGFGAEVKRRILLGAHILSASEYEWLYLKAMDIRTSITEQFIHYFDKEIDIILWPTTPDIAPKRGQNTSDPVKDYLADAYTVIANITGLPALSIPAWTIQEEDKNLPVWVQLIARHGWEEDLLWIAEQWEKEWIR